MGGGKKRKCCRILVNLPRQDPLFSRRGGRGGREKRAGVMRGFLLDSRRPPWNPLRSPEDMTRRIAKPVSTLFLLLLLALPSAQAQLAPPPLEPASTGGLAEVDRALARL